MLAKDLIIELKKSYEVIAQPKEELDICDFEKVLDAMHSLKPEIVINCAAFTKVDVCEEQHEKAFAVNTYGAKNLAMVCDATGVLLLHLSTDFVFDGMKNEPYTETDKPHPLSIYAKSKLNGEKHIQNILKRYAIIRTSWLYGRGGKNFVSTITKLAHEKRELRVVDDQRGSPTYTVDLAKAIKTLLDTSSAQGIYHVANLGSCTWFDFAKKILEIANNTVKIVPISSKEFGRPAQRPPYSVLDCKRFLDATGSNLRSWEVALREYMQIAYAGIQDNR
jgi:dTDP-4-dehydrorhamnose reductase